MGVPEKPEEVAFYRELLLHTYQDAVDSCDPRSSARRADIRTLRARSKAEGMAFLTKALPSLGKCLDKALSKDDPFEAPEGFALSKVSPRFPLLFGELWKRIFDQDGRVAVDDAGIPLPGVVEAVRAVRQVCYLLYKLEGSHSRESELSTISDFIAVDGALPRGGDVISHPHVVERALENARLLAWLAIGHCDLADIAPKHGPGAVSTGEKPAEKMNFRRLYASLERKYPFTDYFFLNYTHLAETLESLELLEEHENGVAKVTLVPKDSRGPRLISMEPLEIQWIQQGQMRVLFRAIEDPQAITSGFVNFTDQSINQELAKLSSVCGDFVTVDMKEASDRVSLWLVRNMLPGNILEYLEASRSTHTRLPDGTLLELRKFAPMGSSVCFPVEALVFWALAVGALQHRNWVEGKKYFPPVYVFGDDMVLLREDFSYIRPIFEALHLRFNEAKCCTGRFFRESCGVDAFFGQIVTPLRISTRFRRKMSPAALLSYVSYHNSLQRRGYFRSATFLRACCADEFRKLPYGHSDGVSSLTLVRHDLSATEIMGDLISRFKTRWNEKLHRYEIRVPVVRSPSFYSGVPDWGELLRLLPQMGPPDPFGLRGERASPCRYPVTRPDKNIQTGWGWKCLQGIIQSEV